MAKEEKSGISNWANLEDDDYPTFGQMKQFASAAVNFEIDKREGMKGYNRAKRKYKDFDEVAKKASFFLKENPGIANDFNQRILAEDGDLSNYAEHLYTDFKAGIDKGTDTEKERKSGGVKAKYLDDQGKPDITKVPMDKMGEFKEELSEAQAEELGLEDDS